MTRDEAAAILKLPENQAINRIIGLAEKAEKYDQICDDVSPATPSGMKPPYLNPCLTRFQQKRLFLPINFKKR